jgi:hypothetical protein
MNKQNARTVLVLAAVAALGIWFLWTVTAPKKPVVEITSLQKHCTAQRVNNFLNGEMDLLGTKPAVCIPLKPAESQETVEAE